MPHTGIVQQLVDYYNDPANVDFKTNFDQSFDNALATGLSIFDEYNVHTVEEYFTYMDTYVNWVPYEDKDSTNVYYHICLFHFILDLWPVSEEKDIIDPSTVPP